MFLSRILFLVLLQHLGQSVECEGDGKVLMKQSLVQGIQDFVRKTDGCQIPELGEVVRKAEEKDQALNSTCDHPTWQRLLKPIYTSLLTSLTSLTSLTPSAAPADATKTCEELKDLVSAARADPSFLEHVCLSKTHVMQCSHQASHCECLHVKALGSSRNHGFHGKQKHNGETRHADHLHPEHRASEQCLVEKDCEGPACAGIGSRPRSEALVWLSLLMLSLLAFPMASNLYESE